MHWFEVYHEHYGEKGYDTGEENSVLPYSVRCKNQAEKSEMVRTLKRDKIKCVGNGDGYLSLLINLRFRKWCTYQAPCKHACYGDRQYTVKEFTEKIYEPWKRGELVPNTQEKEPEPWGKRPVGLVGKPD